MTFCQQCGARLEDGARFCTGCGRSVVPAPPGNKGRRWPWIIAVVLLGTGLACTGWRLAPYLAGGPTGNRGGGEAVPAQAQADGDGSVTLPADPVEAARRIQEGAEQVVGAVLGGGGQRDRPPLVPADPGLNAGLAEVERAADYRYERVDCTRLFSDVLQQAGLAIGHQVAAATAVSAEEEDELGRELAGELAKELGERLDPPAEAGRLAYVRKLGAALAAGVERTEVRYTFHLVEDESFNAFAIPGGNIYVHTGLLDAVANEAQLAGVLAHEIVHVDRRHCVAMYQVLAALPGAAANPVAFIALRMAGHPFQGRAESEADEEGLRMVYALGYSPFQVVRLWEERGDGEDDGQAAEVTVGDPAAMLGAVVGVLAEEAANVLNDHPDEGKRACLLKNVTLALLEEAPRELVYVGVRNLREKRAMSEQRF